MTTASDGIWESPRPLALGATTEISLGPLRVWLERREHEWRAVHNRSEGNIDLPHGITVPAMSQAPAGVEPTRYVAPPGHGIVTLRPRLADRPVVIRPDMPLRILPGCDVDIYVSTPVWLTAILTSGAPLPAAPPVRLPLGAHAHANPDEFELFEMPVSRPSDTWFGPSTIEGELAYISKTSARLSITELPSRPGRAVTRIRVRNRRRDAMTLERVLLPAPELQLYVDDTSHLWSQAVDVELTESGVADIRFLAGPPIHAPNANAIGHPRRVESRHLLVRALSAFWP